ncbi:unnamed protein product [Ilex paraguariensis]|uniref:Uncharacterized protein n=1 Tax=Ilex paraguariensis TaxID=185542 RepID=A0ABC8RST6_9AQUA
MRIQTVSFIVDMTHIQALVLQRRGSLMEPIDPRLGYNFSKEGAMRMIKTAILCTNPLLALRPNMSAVVSMLEGHVTVQELNMGPSIYSDELKFKALRDKYEELELQNCGEIEILIPSAHTIHNGSSSTTAQDLYPISLGSSY